MYKNHLHFKTPENNTVVWRYLSFAKFMSLINERQLYFARKDKFFDSFEGTLSTPDIDFFERVNPDLIRELPGCAFINCWIISDIELYLMWSAYSSLDEGIAIKTNIGNIIKSLDPNDKREVYISDVKYLDYINDSTIDKTNGSANLLAPFFCKRKYFQQENELRLVYYDYQKSYNDNTFGIRFDVDINALIDEVWVSPQANEWFTRIVQNELRLHKINKTIKRSVLIHEKQI